jgi:hypothetical protein
MKTVLIYVNTSKQVGDVDHLKVFVNEEAAEKWFAENDPEGVAFEYPVIGAGEDWTPQARQGLQGSAIIARAFGFTSGYHSLEFRAAAEVELRP